MPSRPALPLLALATWIAATAAWAQPEDPLARAPGWTDAAPPELRKVLDAAYKSHGRVRATSGPSHSLAELGYRAAGEDEPAVGPDLLAAGRDRTALYDAVGGRVLLFDASLTLERAFHVGPAEDLALIGDDTVLLLQGRKILVSSASGEREGSIPLPALVPVGGRLHVEEGSVAVEDVLGNRHVVAEDLRPVDGGIRRGEHPTRWERGALVVSGAGALSLPGAALASGRVLDGGGRRWLLADVALSTTPLRVARLAKPLDGPSITFPLPERADAPYLAERSEAADAHGRLVCLLASGGELRLLRLEVP